MVRAGLEAMVRSNPAFEFTGALSLADLEMGLDRITADVLVLELPQLDEDWLALLSSEPVPVVLLTQSPDPALFRSGIRAILSTDSSAPEIAAAIASASLGLITVQPFALELLSTEARHPPAALEEPLSPREREVLTLLAEGLSNKVLAYRLGISEHTVKFHITSIMGKLRASSRTDAVMQGIRRGLVLI